MYVDFFSNAPYTAIPQGVSNLKNAFFIQRAEGSVCENRYSNGVLTPITIRKDVTHGKGWN